MRKKCLWILWTMLLLTGLPNESALAGSYPETTALETPLPYQEAQTMAGMTAKNGVFLAAHLLSDKESKNYFAHELSEDEYLPILVVVSNTTPLRLLVQGADATLLAQGREITQTPGSEVMLQSREHISLQVVSMDRPERKYNEYAIRQAAHFQNFNRKGLSHRILEPGQSVSGMIFFPGRNIDKDALNLRILAQDLGQIRYLELEARVQ